MGGLVCHDILMGGLVRHHNPMRGLVRHRILMLAQKVLRLGEPDVLARAFVVSETASLNHPHTPVRLLLGVYAWSAFWSACPLLGWGRYGPEGHGLCCSLDWHPVRDADRLFILAAAVVALFLPALALSFFYWRIVVTVHRTKQRAGLAKTGQTGAEAQLHLVSVTLVLGFMLAWVPYATVCLLGAFYGHGVSGPGAVAVVTLLSKNSGWYNPVIYLLFSKRYR
ncbi:rhodopsin-like [Pollicipes pollicipes]|uniref:rhodopsin-like n=1 Tax=Pollicipes pollicipes TaxID=41117 RepID=UPI0018852FED|nr:rhodopsin-like [Pollicipes pollicipes]